MIEEEFISPDGNQVYELELVIANLTDGTKIAYAKSSVRVDNTKISEEIKKAEESWKSPITSTFIESSTQRTLHAVVNTRKGANGELFIDDIITQSSDKSQDEKNKNSFFLRDTSYRALLTKALDSIARKRYRETETRRVQG